MVKLQSMLPLLSKRCWERGFLLHLVHEMEFASSSASVPQLLVTLLAVPACVATCITRWFDRDDPSGVGDFETLVDLRNEYPGLICLQPTGIEAQTLDGAPASSTGQIFNPFNTVDGFACVNSQQSTDPCKDYSVRFICPPDFCSGE
nr:cartilage intermediate layer protein 1-like [Pogona vitticeps]